jgi:hypothetical protein
MVAPLPNKVGAYTKASGFCQVILLRKRIAQIGYAQAIFTST